jgi:hypothetical protein
VSGLFVGWLTDCGEFVVFIVGLIVRAIRGGLVIDDGGGDGRGVGCSVRGDDVGAERKKETSHELVS